MQDAGQDNAPTHPTKPCVVCHSDIHADASKCVKCGSYQDRSRHLLKYSALGAAILALVPFGSIALSLWRLAGESAADLRAAPLACSRGGIDLAFANQGDRPGIVTGVSFANADAFGLPDRFAMRPEGEDGPLLIEPGRTITAGYRATVAGASTEFPKTTPGTCLYRIDVATATFDGEGEPLEVTCACPD